MNSFTKSPSAFIYQLLYGNILNKENKRINKLIDNLALKNIAKGASSKVMTVDGKILAGSSWVKGIKAQPIADSLKEEALALIKELREFSYHRTYIRQCCSFLIPENDINLQSIRNSFSDLVSNHIIELNGYERTDVEMCYILHKPALIRQWEKCNYHLEFYIGNILVFG